jgi:hypothetical protein
MRKKGNEWLYFSQSYLSFAKLGCQELLTPGHSKFNSNNRFYYSERDILIPILFNVKHGIEIFIKTLCIFLYGNYNGDSHDIKSLFLELEQKIRESFQSNKIKPVEKNKDKITEDDIGEIMHILKELERIINEFYEIIILEKNIKNSATIKDKENDFLRYPDSKSLTVNWKKIFSSIDKPGDSTKPKEILNSIDVLQKSFNKLGYIFDTIFSAKT